MTKVSLIGARDKPGAVYSKTVNLINVDGSEYFFLMVKRQI